MPETDAEQVRFADCRKLLVDYCHNAGIDIDILDREIQLLQSRSRQTLRLGGIRAQLEWLLERCDSQEVAALISQLGGNDKLREALLHEFTPWEP